MKMVQKKSPPALQMNITNSCTLRMRSRFKCAPHTHCLLVTTTQLHLGICRDSSGQRPRPPEKMCPGQYYGGKTEAGKFYMRGSHDWLMPLCASHPADCFLQQTHFWLLHRDLLWLFPLLALWLWLFFNPFSVFSNCKPSATCLFWCF
jgi:hypothetical protein